MFGLVLKRLALFASALLLGVVLLELGVRWLVPQQLLVFHPGIWVPEDSGLGHGLARDLDTRINTGEREVRVLTDAFGRRIGPESPLDAERRVITVGDSFLEAFAVDHAHSIAGRMETLLAEAWGEPVRVLNTGVSGSNPNHYRIRAERELSRAPAEAVVAFLFLDNDIVERRTETFPPRASKLERSFHWPEEPTWRGVMDGLVHPLYTELRLRSHLVVLLKRRLLDVLVGFGFTDHAFPSLLRPENADSPRFEVTADIAAEIAALGEAHGARVLFVVLPPDYQVDTSLGEAFARGAGLTPEQFDLDQSRRRLVGALLARDLEVLDAMHVLRASLAAGEAPYGRVDRHLSPTGQDRVARAVVARLTGSSEGGTGPRASAPSSAPLARPRTDDP